MEVDYKALHEQDQRQIEVLMDALDQCKEVKGLEQCIQCEVKFWPRRSDANNEQVFCSVECEEENKRENR